MQERPVFPVSSPIAIFEKYLICVQYMAIISQLSGCIMAALSAICMGPQNVIVHKCDEACPHTYTRRNQEGNLLIAKKNEMLNDNSQNSADVP